MRFGDWKTAIEERIENCRDMARDGIEDNDFTVSVDGVVKPEIAKPDE
jgi:hypothetical protein